MKNDYLFKRNMGHIIGNYTMVRIHLLVILFLSISYQCVAQNSISGKVVDDHKVSIPFATIILKIKTTDTLLKKIVLSDNAGDFLIQNIQPGTVHLTISSVGYISYEQDVSFGNEHTLKLPEIVLHDDRQTLSGVTISGRKPLIQQKTDRLVMNVSGSVLASGNDAYNILAMAPSVQLINGNLSMAGKSNVLILLNGKRLPNATLESILAGIPGEQIERIEFITNPSSKYDADASGGVIEIYTKRSSELGWTAGLSGNVAQGYRTGGGGDANFRLSTKKLDLTVSSGYHQRGHIERGFTNRDLYDGRTKVGDFSQTIDISSGKMTDKDLNGSLSYQLGRNDVIGTEVNLMKVSLNGSGNLDAVINQQNDRSVTNTFNDVLLSIAFSNYNVFYKKTFDTLGSNLLVTANYARYTSGKNQQFNQHITDENTGDMASSVFRNTAPATYDIYTGTADYTGNFKSGAKIETGLKYTLTDNHSSQLVETYQNGSWTGSGPNRLGYQERIYAGYVNFNQKIGKFSFQAGLRAEQSSYKVTGGIDSSYFSLFPNLRAEYQVSENYSSSLSYARNINRPSYDNLIPYELFIDSYTSSRGNAYLRPEYAQSFSWNHIYKTYSLRLAYTRTSDAISDILFYDENALRFIETQANFLTQHLASAVLSVPVKLTSWWEMNNDVSLYRKELKYPSPFDQTEVITRNKTYYSLNTLNSFTFKKGYSAEISAYYNSPSIRGVYSFKAYSNVSAGIKKTLLKGKAYVKLDVSDIFYKNNLFSTTNVIPIVTEGINRTDTRRVRISFRYNFGRNASKREKIDAQGNSNELNRLNL